MFLLLMATVLHLRLLSARYYICVVTGMENIDDISYLTFGQYQTELDVYDERKIIFELPRHGEDCGYSGFKTIVCPTKKHYIRRPMSCNKSSCPRHYEGWVKKEASRIVLRVNNFLEHRRNLHKHSVVQHVIVSAPLWMLDDLPSWTKGYRAYINSFVRNILAMCGIHGGVMVFHPHRIPDFYNDYEVKNDGIHWHVIAFGKLNPDACRVVYDRMGGWIIKGKGRPDSIRDVAEYILSHCGIPYYLTTANIIKKSIGHASIWFGCVSYSRFKSDFIKTDYDILCSLCNKYYLWRDWYRVEHRDKPPPHERGAIKELGEVVLVYPDGERELLCL